MTLNRPFSTQICTCTSRIFHTSCKRHFWLHPQCKREASEKVLMFVRDMYRCTLNFRTDLLTDGFFSLTETDEQTGCTVFGVTSLMFLWIWYWNKCPGRGWLVKRLNCCKRVWDWWGKAPFDTRERGTRKVTFEKMFESCSACDSNTENWKLQIISIVSCGELKGYKIGAVNHSCYYWRWTRD